MNAFFFLPLSSLSTHPQIDLPTITDYISQMIDCKPDFILKIEHPIFSEDTTKNSVQIIVVEPTNGTKWRVNLRKTYEFLQVDVKCVNIQDRRINGEYMHFVPMNGGKPVTFEVSSYALEGLQMASGRSDKRRFIVHPSCAFMR